MAISPGEEIQISAYAEFSRADWAGLRASTPLPLSEAQLRPLGGLTERLSLDEVADIYLPLSRLLNISKSSSLLQANHPGR